MEKLLKNLKWYLLPFTVGAFLLFVEAGTDSDGISNSEEGVMYTAWTLVIANVCLFVFNRKWQDAVSRWF